MRADRLLSIVLLLQVHKRLTSEDLAKRLEVSRRTVMRDMDALSAAGVPVLAERGPGGGWALDRAWRTDLTGLDSSELNAVFLAQPPRILADLGLSSAADRAMVKLLASLPTAQRHGAAVMRERLHIDVESWWTRSEQTPWLRLVQEAVWLERMLEIRYATRPNEATVRCVEPLGLVVKNSAWYLVARHDGEFRTYRVSRIESALLLHESFARPDGFDLAAHWTSSAASYVNRRPTYEATLRVDRRGAGWLRGRVWQIATPGQAGSSTASNGAGHIDSGHVGPGHMSSGHVSPSQTGPRCNGPIGDPFSGVDASETHVTVTLRFEREDEACFLALGLGASAEVIAPESLRTRVLTEAARIAERGAATAAVAPAAAAS